MSFEQGDDTELRDLLAGFEFRDAGVVPIDRDLVFQHPVGVYARVVTRKRRVVVPGSGRPAVCVLHSVSDWQSQWICRHRYRSENAASLLLEAAVDRDVVFLGVID